MTPKHQMVTIRVTVPTYNSVEASKTYLPKIIEAIEGANPEDKRAGQMVIRGMSIGTMR